MLIPSGSGKCMTIDLIQKSTNQQGQKWQLFFHFRFSVIDLIQKSINQQGQKWQLFFHFRFSVIMLSVLLQQ
jgi:hypothetical protein